jgi:hypothetical protein
MCADDGTSHRGGRGQPRQAGVGTGRDRAVVVRPFPPNRRLVTAAVRAGRRIMPMHGLFDVDITTARRLLGMHEPPLSLTAFVVASIGRAAAAHPEVHAYRNWRGRLVEHHYVDVQTLIGYPPAKDCSASSTSSATPTSAASATSAPRYGPSRPTRAPPPAVAC